MSRLDRFAELRIAGAKGLIRSEWKQMESNQRAR
jgi:hypothetical protein